MQSNQTIKYLPSKNYLPRVTIQNNNITNQSSPIFKFSNKISSKKNTKRTRVGNSESKTTSKQRQELLEDLHHHSIHIHPSRLKE